jgi:hypothetical protein
MNDWEKLGAVLALINGEGERIPIYLKNENLDEKLLISCCLENGRWTNQEKIAVSLLSNSLPKDKIAIKELPEEKKKTLPG